jgi:hypothetical protein
MRLLLISALLTLMSALLMAAQAKVETPCSAFGRICECEWYVRDCLPTCHLQPQIECKPNHWAAVRP